MKVKVIRAYKDSKEQKEPYKIDAIQDIADDRAKKLIASGFVVETFENKQLELEKEVKALKKKVNEQEIAINEKDTKIATLSKDLEAYKEMQEIQNKESKAKK